jgi:GSH-dependent disulfide-bond oxidoreductase
MIELFYSSSPNVLKVMVALEEMKLDYEIRFVDLSKGEQFDADKIAGSPTAKVPVLRDHAPDDGGAPITVFESGAIMTYLAEKTGRFLPTAPRERLEVLQWLTWQMANLGPIGGQFWHFERFAERLEPGTDFTYPRRRYRRMLDAIWDVMEARLSKSDHLAGGYSIADMACFPWVHYLDHGADRRPALARWHGALLARPAVQDAYRRSVEFKTEYGRNERQGVAYPFEGLARNTLVS